MPDKVTINGNKLFIETDEGKKVERDASLLDEMFKQEFQPLTDGIALPDGTKFVEHQGPLMVVCHQQPAHVRQLRWIAPDSPREYGPGTKYRKVRLSFPYTITLATFMRQPQGGYQNYARNELYFSPTPIVSKDTMLYYPALLNISVMTYGAGEKKRRGTWICTQYLQQDPSDHWTKTLEHLLEHTWNGAFNRSSEHHEGASWYGAYSDNNKLHPVEKWEELSRQDDAFGLKVEWKPAAKVGDIMQCMLAENTRTGQNKSSVVSRIIKAAKV